jgi:hypothetical protein
MLSRSAVRLRPSSPRVCGSHRKQVVIADRPYVTEVERSERLRPSCGRHELHLECVRGVDVHHCTEISCPKTRIREIPHKDYGVELM